MDGQVKQYEENQALRTLSATILDADGELLAIGTTWSAGQVKISRNGGALANAAELPVAVTGGGDGAFDLSFSVSEVSVLGSLRVRFYDSEGALIAEFTDEVTEDADDAIAQHESVASNRLLDVTIYDANGDLLDADTEWSAGMVKVSKAGGAFANASALPVTEGSDGAFQLQLSIGEVDTVGNVRVRFYTSGGTLLGEYVAPVRAVAAPTPLPASHPQLVLVSAECECVFIEEGIKMRTITRRQGDRLPAIEAVVFDEGQRVDLTAFETIVFRMVSGETEIEGSATGDVNGNLRYELADGDTDTPGTYTAVFVATDSDDRVQTFPTGSNLTVVVIAGL